MEVWEGNAAGVEEDVVLILGKISPKMIFIQMLKFVEGIAAEF